MKTRALQFLVATLFCLSAVSIWAGEYKTVVLTPSGTSTLTVDIPQDGFMLVRNFTQEPGAGTTRAVINVTNDAGDDADVLAASIVSSDTTKAVEVVNSIIIAGKATVTVTCPSDATNCVITYRKTNGSN